jgi:nicotinamidase-related amidase
VSQRSVDSPSTLPDWVFPWPAFDMAYGSCALMVIDYQNYSVNPACGLTRLVIERHPHIARYYVPRIREVTIPNTRRLLQAFREAGREVIFTRNGGLLPDGRDLIPRRRRRDAEAWDSTGAPTLWSAGTFEHEIIEELTPLPGEPVIDKNSSSPFNGTGIDQLLRNLGIDCLFLSGMATDMCVENTVRDASDRGFNVVVLEDAVATFVPEHHYAALSALARVYVQVWSTAGALTWLAAASGEANRT